jgi:putative addiction module component (TIGR02574 family)
MSALELKEQLATLCVEDRAGLALYLIESLDAETDMNADQLWEAELERRVEEIRQGVAASEPAEIVMQRLWRKHS